MRQTLGDRITYCIPVVFMSCVAHDASEIRHLGQGATAIWTGQSGIVCEACAEPFVCTSDLACSVEPTADCEPNPEDVICDDEHACWFLLPELRPPLEQLVSAEDLFRPLELCDGCCGRYCFAVFPAACEPVVCDSTSKPPHPYVCHGGRIGEWDRCESFNASQQQRIPFCNDGA